MEYIQSWNTWLFIRHPEENSAAVMLSETLQAPHLCHLSLGGFAPPRVLTTTVGLVTLGLTMDDPSAYIHSNTLLQHLLFMLWLKTLKIVFITVDPNHDVEGQLMHTLITTSVTLPNLLRIRYRGHGTYLDVILCQITTPRLEKLYSTFFWEPTTSIPCLPRFIKATKNLHRFNNAEITFTSKQARVALFSWQTSQESQRDPGACPFLKRRL
jgi:hypothetical protein